MITGMQWYLVKMVYQIVRADKPLKPQFDEQWRCLMADELSWAHEKAKILGRLEESTFLNEKQESITWKFIDVTEVIYLGKMEDGTLIYSQTEEPEDELTYIARVQESVKKMHFKNQLTGYTEYSG